MTPYYSHYTWVFWLIYCFNQLKGLNAVKLFGYKGTVQGWWGRGHGAGWREEEWGMGLPPVFLLQ